MSVPSKAYIVQLVQVQREVGLAVASEPSPAPDGVICHREARGMGIPSHNASEGIEPRNTCRVGGRYCSFSRRQNSHNRYWRDCASPTGSETVARYQMDNIGTWESHNAPERVWVAKSEEGKAMQMTLWQSDKPIVAMKSRNWDGAKGLTGRPLEWDTTVRLRNEARLLTKLKSNDLFDRRQRGFSHRAV